MAGGQSMRKRVAMPKRVGMPKRVAGLAGVAALLVSVTGICLADPAQRTFTVVTDIHFNPFDPPDLAARLADADPAQWPDIFASLSKQQAAPFGSDTNHALFRSALADLTETGRTTDFVLVPGDLLTHRFQAKAGQALAGAPDHRETEGPEMEGPEMDGLAAKTAIYVARSLQAAFPGKPIIVALGNNDSGCGDYEIAPEGGFLQTTAPVVRALLGSAEPDPDFEATYVRGGYYSARHPTRPQDRIVVINDILWSAKYRDGCSDRGDAAAGEMMAWLEDRLGATVAAGGRIWLMRHIPAGFDAFGSVRASQQACTSVVYLRAPYRDRFHALLRTYAGSIETSLTGHTHHDSYRLWTDAAGSAVGFDKVVPAISPVYDQNPSYQIFDYDPQSGRVTDFRTRYLTNLADTSLDNRGLWREEYRFTEAYAQDHYDAAAVEDIWQGLEAGGAVAETFSRLYPVSHGTLPADGFAAYVCAIGYIDDPAFNTCWCDR